jgi:hypothetical protein
MLCAYCVDSPLVGNSLAVVEENDPEGGILGLAGHSNRHRRIGFAGVHRKTY